MPCCSFPRGWLPVPDQAHRRSFPAGLPGRERRRTMQLEGKRIIVTGGASGIAAATVLAYAREGASVVSVDINDDAGRAFAEQADGLGPGSVSYEHCDISNQDEVNRVFEAAVEKMGGLDALANIA